MFKGTRVLVKNRELLNASSNLLYFSATTLSGLQTLGEEYTGILQFDKAQSDIPTLRVSYECLFYEYLLFTFSFIIFNVVTGECTYGLAMI